MESCINFGQSACLFGEITVKNSTLEELVQQVEAKWANRLIPDTLSGFIAEKSTHTAVPRGKRNRAELV